MKKRFGFVSNSSASSFCLYCVDVKEAFELSFDNMFEFSLYIVKDFNSFLKKNNRGIADRAYFVETESGKFLFGVGEYEMEFDHWYCGGEDDLNWEDYKSNPPSKEICDLFDLYLKENEVKVVPAIMADTWFEG